MVKLSNSPYESTVLILEARKSFSLRIELHDRHGNLMSWDNLSATFTLGTLDPLEALLEVSATDGVFRIQASELNLKPGTYQFTITLRSRGYSFVIVKGDVKLVQNTEAGSVADVYGAAIPSETIAVQLDQMNVLKVSLRNTPLTLGTSVVGATTWSELVGKPLVFPPAQHVHDLQDVGGLVQVLTDLTASLDGMAPKGHYHPISDVIGLQPALDAKAPTEHEHEWGDITGKPTAFPSDAPENTVRIGGVDYQASGKVSITTPAWTVSTPPIYATTASFARPYAPPAGYGFEVHLQYSAGFTVISTTDTAHTSSNVTFRIIQFNNAGLLNLGIGWRLTKV